MLQVLKNVTKIELGDFKYKRYRMYIILMWGKRMYVKMT